MDCNRESYHSVTLQPSQHCDTAHYLSVYSDVGGSKLPPCQSYKSPAPSYVPWAMTDSARQWLSSRYSANYKTLTVVVGVILLAQGHVGRVGAHPACVYCISGLTAGD